QPILCGAQGSASFHLAWTIASSPAANASWVKRSEARISRLERKSAARKSSQDRKSTRLNSSHVSSSYAVFCLKKKYLNEWLIGVGSTAEWSCGEVVQDYDLT